VSIATQIANPEMESGAEQTQARAPADVAAWFDEALPGIYGYFLPRVGGRIAVAEDLTQETILAAGVYFTDAKVTTVALGITDGVERWRDDRSDDFSAVFGYTDEITFPLPGTIVTNKRYVSVLLPDGRAAGRTRSACW